MAKSKLKQALNRQLGKDPVREKQLKISKKKPKKSRNAEDSDGEVPELIDTATLPAPKGSDSEEEREESEKENASRDKGKDAEDDEEDEEEEDEGNDDDEDVAFSDLGEDDLEEDADVIPHQKLTIDNHAALTQLRNSIALPIAKMPFSEHQSVTTPAPVAIKDIDDDLKRELAFYAQALSAARTGRDLLKKEGVKFSRPADYFAEMMKDDEHMGRIKQKLLDEAEGKKRAQEARKLRDLKKFGKQVQVQKLQERDKAKKETLEKINILKRKRKESDNNFAEEEDMFDVALEEHTKDTRGGRSKGGKGGKGGAPNPKRAKRDAKFGFGGKKRFSKSGDAVSSGDLSRFSTKKNREGFGGPAKKKGKTMRPGKSKRAAKRQ